MRNGTVVVRPEGAMHTAVTASWRLRKGAVVLKYTRAVPLASAETVGGVCDNAGACP